ncbi:hypothetical protein DY000_02022739 [Brassica cretica]|uniref:START domain-containing protein n=1 Tax=Brassica cretica TaxID=69181 RepID=A0ABQ7E2U7_BRACR|nr:hypothetical protein DY000_02022739 [Brassica cretica]
MYTKPQNKQVELIKVGSQLRFLQTFSASMDVIGRPEWMSTDVRMLISVAADLKEESDPMYTKPQNKQVELIKVGSQLRFLQTFSASMDVIGRTIYQTRMDVNRCEDVDIGRGSLSPRLSRLNRCLISVAYVSAEISAPWLCVSDITDVAFCTSLPRFVASSTNVRL